jgi:putative phage-type endonuclease
MTKRVLKFNDAFESYLNHLIRDCNISIDELIKPSPVLIKNLGELVEMTLKEILPKFELFKKKINYTEAVEDNLKKRYFYKPPQYQQNDIETIDKKLNILDSHHKHEQRSPEWYQFRWERLTASDLAKAIGEKGDKSRLELVYQKSMSLENYIKQRDSFSLGGQPAIQHGVCFEDVAVALYELKNKVTVNEYGCLPHMTLDYLAASPDGICFSKESNSNYHGRMLEIKCPYSRVITGVPKLEYYMQVQLQLEVCDLEYCDFLECDIRVYNNITEFLMDSPKDKTTSSLEHVSYSLTSSGKEKGVLYEYFEKGSNSSKYKYCPLGLSNEEIQKWMESVRKEINDSLIYHSGNYKFWWIEEFNTVLLKREREYFNTMKKELEEFWKLVVHYRKNGVDELEYKLGVKQRPQTTLDSHLTTDNISNDINYLTFDDNQDKVNINDVCFIESEDEKEKEEVILDAIKSKFMSSDIKPTQKNKAVNKKSAQMTFNDIDFIDEIESEPQHELDKKEKKTTTPPPQYYPKKIMVIKPDSDEE